MSNEEDDETPAVLWIQGAFAQDPKVVGCLPATDEEILAQSCVVAALEHERKEHGYYGGIRVAMLRAAELARAAGSPEAASRIVEVLAGQSGTPAYDPLKDPLVVAALRKAYATDPAKVLLPWEQDPDEAEEGCVVGRMRRNLRSENAVCCGIAHGRPLWLVVQDLSMGELDGGEPEADAWLLANGYVLLDGEGK